MTLKVVVFTLFIIFGMGCAYAPLEEGSLAWMWNERAREVEKECNSYFFDRQMHGVTVVYIEGFPNTWMYCGAVAKVTRDTGHEVQYRIKERR